MSLTPSTMLPLGTPAPAFELVDVVSGRLRTLAELGSPRATLVMFICNHCPYVKHVNTALVRLAEDYQPRGISVIAISSNDAERYPEDGPRAMAQTAALLGYPFPYLYDEAQTVAQAYRAACTPDFFVFDASLRLVYRGQLDDSRPGNDWPVSGRDIRAALDALLDGRAVDPAQTPSVGCNIKFRTGF